MTPAALAAARAPDLVEAIVGYRQWRVQDATLFSPYVDYARARGVNTARCEVADGHPDPAPAHRCVCGLHAWYRPCPRLGSAVPDLVAGAVALWGDVELHITGLRAQYAAVVALVRPLAHTPKRRRVTEIAEALEIDVVPAGALQACALRHGRPLSNDWLAATLRG
jgi:hypothetical protein